jgi:hypothetical protein
MYCQKCSGDLYVDKSTITGTKFDLVCLYCGDRKFLDAKTNAFSKYLFDKVKTR